MPEAEDLLVRSGQFRPATIPGAAGQVFVVLDERYRRHLEGLCHLEGPKRMDAVRDILSRPELKGRWVEVPPRPATPSELGWVHTQAHIARVAATAGQPVSVFDLDTQTSERSYEVARLAAGGVFTMLDALYAEPGRRGFAFIRPPGHHAEPGPGHGVLHFQQRGPRRPVPCFTATGPGGS